MCLPSHSGRIRLGVQNMTRCATTFWRNSGSWASSRRSRTPLASAHATPTPEECRTFSRECPADRVADQRSFLLLITTVSKPDRVPETMAPVSPPFSRPFALCKLDHRLFTILSCCSPTVKNRICSGQRLLYANIHGRETWLWY